MKKIYNCSTAISKEFEKISIEQILLDNKKSVRYTSGSFLTGSNILLHLCGFLSSEHVLSKDMFKNVFWLIKY